MLGSTPHENLRFDNRKRRILYALITEYVATGEPVGSRRLAKGYGLNLSAASIRGVLSDLEEEGLLAQPHTSAGRVPTELGFRVFVDALVQVKEITDQKRNDILDRMRSLRPGRDMLFREAGRLLSALTGAAAIVSAPKAETETLSQIRFIRVRSGVLLAVVVTRSGGVQNRIIEVQDDVDERTLESLNNFLASMVTDRTLLELRDALAGDAEDERTEIGRLSQRAQDLCRALDQGGNDASAIIIEGEDALFDSPEFRDAERLRSLLKTLQEKERIVQLLDKTLLASGVQVLIGTEADLGDVPDMSVVTAGYRVEDASRGSLGIIGPMRMDYAKVLPIVGFTAKVMSMILSQEDPDWRDDDDV